MKIRTLMSACLAGFGIYHVIIGSMSVVVSLSWLTIPAVDSLNQRISILQVLGFSMPFVVGLVLLVFAPKLAAIACRFAKIGDAEITTVLHPQTVLVTACVITGLVMAIGQIPEVVQLASQHFLVAANPIYAAENRATDFRVMMIVPTLYTALSLALIWKARALSTWILSRDEKS